MENKLGGWRNAEERQMKKEEAQKEKTKTNKTKEAEEVSWSAPLTYEVV